jgi:3-deoxy-D-manno-octulosonic-acid transferase
LWLLQPAYVLKLWWRGRREPLYRRRMGERFGFYRDPAPVPGALWLHAVSLGETRAAAGLIDALRARRPEVRLLLTHGTATGLEAGRSLLREGDAQAWLPYDTPGAVRRFLAHHRPALGLLMETEVWPVLQQAALQCGVPMVLVNARLSERSLHQGRRLRALMQPAARSLALALAQTEGDAARLRAMGVRRVAVCGNLKFDMTPPDALVTQGQAWRQQWQGGSARSVVLAASTREGEEGPLLAAWRKLTEPRPLLVLVPRHPQRFDEVAALVRSAGWQLLRRSGWGQTPAPMAGEVDVILGDSLGEMPAYYAAADVALLGGSFAPLGGQNLIEAAACGCPVIMGPHTFNFAEAAELSVQAGAALRVRSIEDAVVQAARVAACSQMQSAMSQRSRDFAAAHRGAAARMAQHLLALSETGGR